MHWLGPMAYFSHGPSSYASVWDQFWVPCPFPVAIVHSQRVNHSEKKDVLYGSVEVEIHSGEPAVLLSYEWFATYAAKQLGITIGKCWAPQKPHHHRLTLLKSVHIYKKHRVQYEVRTYFRHMIYERLTESTLKTFLEYIQRNVPEGVSLKISKKSFMNLPAQLTDHVSSVTLKQIS
uniref:Small ribosomal subunit protein uS10m n=1 Tax=Daphnia pulicaria TaxID=35523 RepID=A0A4Y7MYK2_9CRUS|nr:EOG090X0GP9 [Daphnia pulicaria]